MYSYGLQQIKLYYTFNIQILIANIIYSDFSAGCYVAKKNFAEDTYPEGRGSRFNLSGVTTHIIIIYIPIAVVT
jgi:hypothetical protein